jgi:hypothetical protein
VIYIDGIGVPTGSVQINQVDHETLIVPTIASSGTLPAQPNLEGVGIVSTITDGNGFQVTYGLPGEAPPPFLYDEFSGFTINNNPAATYVDSSGALHIALQGGQLSYFRFATDQSAALGAAVSPGAAVSLVETGALWLSLQPQAVDAFGDTFLITLPSGNAANVHDGVGLGYLDVVTGAGAGPANAFFNTCTEPDTNATGTACRPGETDFSFVGGSNNVPGATVSTVFPVSGTDHLDGDLSAIPEPMSLSLFGAGLIGVGFVARRRKSKKS